MYKKISPNPVEAPLSEFTQRKSTEKIQIIPVQTENNSENPNEYEIFNSKGYKIGFSNYEGLFSPYF